MSGVLKTIVFLLLHKSGNFRLSIPWLHHPSKSKKSLEQDFYIGKNISNFKNCRHLSYMFLLYTANETPGIFEANCNCITGIYLFTQYCRPQKGPKQEWGVRDRRKHDQNRDRAYSGGTQEQTDNFNMGRYKLKLTLHHLQQYLLCLETQKLDAASCFNLLLFSEKRVLKNVSTGKYRGSLCEWYRLVGREDKGTRTFDRSIRCIFLDKEKNFIPRVLC